MRSRWFSSLRACSRSARAVFADSAHGTTSRGRAAVASRAAGACSPSVAGAVSGACSMMVCTLVPLIPNEETAARRGLSWSGQAVCSVSRRTVPPDQSTSGVGSSTCSVCGRTPLRMAITILMTPPTPAAACVWPMLDFSEPSHSGLPPERSSP